MSYFSLQKQNVRIKMIIFNYALIFFLKIFISSTLHLNVTSLWTDLSFTEDLTGGITGENTIESLLNHKLVNVSCYDFI